jgi:hypothetical protein
MAINGNVICPWQHRQEHTPPRRRAGPPSVMVLDLELKSHFASSG